jgi:hypothetical protein
VRDQLRLLKALLLISEKHLSESMRKLADKDELGNSVAHFFKSGNVLRNNKNDDLSEIKALIPKNWTNGTKVEYDLWYNFNDDKVHGYVYTDLMTKFIYLRVASEAIASKAMTDAANGEITPSGVRLFEDICENSQDKYRLRPTNEKHDFVIFLAGTNILNKVTDWAKIERAVKQGAKLKCHPLTAASAYQHLIHRFGEENIIEKKKSGKELLDRAAIVGCCDNSEMGIVALAKGKTVYRFGNKDQWCTYSAIYRALEVNGQLNANRLKSILSSEYSGLIPASDAKPWDKLFKFFTQYSGINHVAPRDFNNRVQQPRVTDS